MRAPDTSPVEEGNPERKGMRNGSESTLLVMLTQIKTVRVVRSSVIVVVFRWLRKLTNLSIKVL